MSTLPTEETLLKRRLQAAERANTRLEKQVGRESAKLERVLGELQELKKQDAAKEREISRLRRACEQLRSDKLHAEGVARDVKTRLHQIETKLPVGMSTRGVASQNAQLRAELALVREESSRLRARVEEQEGQLDQAATEMRSLVEALQVRAEELVPGEELGGDGDEDFGLRGSGVFSGEDLALLSAQLASYPGAEARRAALLFEVGKRRASERRLAGKLAERGEALGHAEEALREARAELERERERYEEAVEEGRQWRGETGAVKEELETVRKRLGAVEKERDAALDYIEETSARLTASEIEVESARGRAQRAERLFEEEKKRADELDRRLRSTTTAQRSTAEALGATKDEISKVREQAEAAERKSVELEAEVARLHRELQELEENNGALRSALDEAVCARNEAEESLATERSERAAENRQSERIQSDAAARERAMREQLERSLTALEAAARDRQDRERKLHDLVSRVTAAEVARAGLETQVTDLTSSLASARYARALLQSTLAEQISHLKAKLEHETSRRQHSETIAQRANAVARAYDSTNTPPSSSTFSRYVAQHQSAPAPAPAPASSSSPSPSSSSTSTTSKSSSSAAHVAAALVRDTLEEANAKKPKMETDTAVEAARRLETQAQIESERRKRQAEKQARDRLRAELALENAPAAEAPADVAESVRKLLRSIHAGDSLPGSDED